MEVVEIGEDVLGSLGTIKIEQPQGVYELTPASRVGMNAIAAHRKFLTGIGLDWGCGTGCMAITAAKIPAVNRIIGLDIEPLNVEAARRNATANNVADIVSFFLSNSYDPESDDQHSTLQGLRGKIDFIVANPPATNEGDGFGWRREVLRGGADFLKPGGRILLCISIQYSAARIEGLCDDVPGFSYEGLVATSDWVPFDMTRADLSRQVGEYAEEEKRGGLEYSFRHPIQKACKIINARDALACYQETGLSPLSKWQNYLFIKK